MPGNSPVKKTSFAGMNDLSSSSSSAHGYVNDNYVESPNIGKTIELDKLGGRMMTIMMMMMMMMVMMMMMM